MKTYQISPAPRCIRERVGLLSLATLLASSVNAQSASVEELVVTASRMPVAAEKVGSAVDVITGEELKLQGVHYLSDALRRVPGIDITRAGAFGGLTQLRLRGAEGNHVLVLVDGIEISTADDGEVDLSTMLASDIARIEILRGPQSGLYGSNAAAGVISVITHDGLGKRGAQINLETGSFGSNQVALAGGGARGNSNGAVSLQYRQADGLNASPEGDEDDEDQALALTARGKVHLTDAVQLDGTLRFVDKDTDFDDFDFSGGPNQGLSVDAPNTQESTDWNIGAGLTFTAMQGRSTTRVAAAFTDTDFAGNTAFGGFGSETSRTKIMLQSSLAFESNPALAQFVTGFVEHEQESFRNTFPFDPSQAPELDRQLTGFGVEYRAEISDQVFLSGAVRHDANDAFDDASTFRLTGAWAIPSSDVRLHASVGTAVTNPTFTEQFGFTPGTFVGNPALTPEEITGWDIGVRKSFDDDRTVVDLTYFDSTLQDEIVSVFPSVANDAGKSERSGVELTVDTRLSDRVSVAAAWAYVDATDPDGTREVLRAKNSGKVDVSYRFADQRGWAWFGIAHNGDRVDNDFRNFFSNGFITEKTQIDGYTLVNAGAGYQVNERFELYGRIENLLDEDYEETIGYNTPGRGFFGGVRMSFGAR